MSINLNNPDAGLLREDLTQFYIENLRPVCGEWMFTPWASRIANRALNRLSRMTGLTVEQIATMIYLDAMFELE